MPGATYSVRVTCPHNCYDTCGQIATVQDGLVTGLEGDPDHPHTQGRLCAKGYSYLHRLYSHERIRHPMIQEPRGSGRWRRLSWTEALDRIAREIINLHDRYGSLLPVCLYQASGNLGVLHRAPAALFGSMGPFTEAVNTLCMNAGYDAQCYDFGGVRNHDPLDMLNARTILLWGVNPAWTAPHQMRLIMQARDLGAKVVAIDPLVTATASRADLHLPIRPGTDGALALGMARHLLEAGMVDEQFLETHTLGWPQWRDYLLRQVTVDWAAHETGIDSERIRGVAERYGRDGPSTIWIGYGMQRYRNGGQSVRAIDALAALTGQIGRPGTGVQYGQGETLSLSGDLWARVKPRVGRSWQSNRGLCMGDLPQQLRTLSDPPVRFLWVAGANPMAQGPNREAFKEALRDLDLVVVVDQFRTRTAAEADIVLPATTYLEQHDLHFSYWHHYASLTQPATAPLFEARSDLVIAQGLAAALNGLRQGFCPFPANYGEQEWLNRIWKETAPLLGGGCWTALQEGPTRVNLPRVAWEGLRFDTPSGRYELSSDRAAANGLPDLPVYVPPVAPPRRHPFRLLTPHPAESLNSQFHSPDWGLRPTDAPFAEVHPEAAERLGLADGAMVRLVNQIGAIVLPLRLTRTVPVDCVVVYSGTYGGGAFSVNEVTEMIPTDMGEMWARRGVAYYENFVTIEPAGDGGDYDAVGLSSRHSPLHRL